MNAKPEQPNRFDVTTEDGKYRFFMRHDGSLGAERHNQPWIDSRDLQVPGINMFSALAMELETARAKLAVYEAEAAAPQVEQTGDEDWKLLPVDLETHLHDFKHACTIARDNAGPATEDSDDAGYWSHQLRTIERVEAMIVERHGIDLHPGAGAGKTASDDPSPDL